MRWFLCFLLVILIILLRADAYSATKANTANTNAKTFIDHGATGPVVLSTHNPNNKRSLRGKNKKTTIVDPSSQQPVIGEEERGISDRFKASMNEVVRKGKDKATNHLYQLARKSIEKYLNNFFKEARELGQTPESLKAFYYQQRTKEEASNTWIGNLFTRFAEDVTEDYRAWLSKNQGRVPK